MSWILVFIVLDAQAVFATGVDEYDSMVDCFYAREELIERVSAGEEHFPKNMNAICIPYQVDSDLIEK